MSMNRIEDGGPNARSAGAPPSSVLPESAESPAPRATPAAHMCPLMPAVVLDQTTRSADERVHTARAPRLPASCGCSAVVGRNQTRREGGWRRPSDLADQ